jgi:hypothetical protein
MIHYSTSAYGKVQSTNSSDRKCSLKFPQKMNKLTLYSLMASPLKQATVENMNLQT